MISNLGNITLFEMYLVWNDLDQIVVIIRFTFPHNEDTNIMQSLESAE